MRQVPDPYRALGLARGATEAEIKAAHRRLAKRYHPDSPDGDTLRFLDVQDAYKLLSDPLRRREWDARHAPGPMRASERARERPRAANGRWTRAEEPARGEARAGAERPPTAGRDPASRTYTWSASEVPWWEEGGQRENRRQPGRKRPHESPREEAQPRADSASAPESDVYSRSSGAAWSMAARAYFRRGESDLPRRGSFHHQGSQPLTAARARVAAEEEARRARPAAPSWVSGRPAAQPNGASAGVVRDAGSISEARASAREEARASRWPSPRARLAHALLAWLPIALLIGYGGSWLTGCDRAAFSCPPEMATVQAVAIALALGLLVALPRLAYALSVATAGVVIAGLALAIGLWFLGLRPPMSAPVLGISIGLLLAIHLGVAAWVLAGGLRRPWLAERRLGRGGSR